MHERSTGSGRAETTDLMRPDDLRLAATLCHEALAPLLDADWDRPAHGLEWPCRRTVQHIANALDWYALLLAGATVDAPPARFLSLGLRYVEQSVPEILDAVGRRATVLGVLAASADPTSRGYHYWGSPDPAGFIAMGCAEILLHTDDIVRGFGQTFAGPDALSRRMVRRLFPWAPPAEDVVDVDGWSLLCWATGRLRLPGYGQVGPDWVWHASPVAEWDGEIKTRASYPNPRG